MIICLVTLYWDSVFEYKYAIYAQNTLFLEIIYKNILFYAAGAIMLSPI